MNRADVVIVGGGVCGIVAASTLVKAGIQNIVLLEAQDRLGGRIDTIPAGNNHIELGAQWIHGQENNPLYEFAKDHQLINQKESYEAEGIFYYGEGKEVPCDIIEEVRRQIYSSYDECDKFCHLDPKTESIPPSVWHFFKQQFDEHINSQKHLSSEEKELKYQVFQYFMKFEKIDNACESMYDLSCLAWGEYEDCEGDRYVNLKHGYKSLIDVLLKSIPSHVIKLNSPVYSICWVPSVREYERKHLVTVTLEDETRYKTNHLIYTPSIGYTKQHYHHLFQPPLPRKQSLALKNLAFGVIDKIFLEYETPFWEKSCRGIHIVWPDDESELPGLPEKPDDKMWHRWYRGISGFDVVAGQSNMLLGWLAGDDARYMESMDQEEVAIVCTNILRYFSGNGSIPQPKNIYRSQWFSNKYIKGSYSYRPNYCDDIESSAEDLADPVCTLVTGDEETQVPVLLISGEGTNIPHYSTVHGAYIAGKDSANKLISWLQPL